MYTGKNNIVDMDLRKRTIVMIDDCITGSTKAYDAENY